MVTRSTAIGQPRDSWPSLRARTIGLMVLTVLAAWVLLAVLASTFVAAVARGGLREN